MKTTSTTVWLALLMAVIASEGCRSGERGSGDAASLTIGAYTTPREVYGKAIIPTFREDLEKRTGKRIEINESYLGSGAQARAIIAGFEADVAALSLEPDIEKLRDAGLIRHDWKAGTHAGMVTRSIVVIGVREGNPKNIKTWQDLALPGIDVLTPNVRTSGGAMWNILAIYGAATRESGKAREDAHEDAVDLLAAILRNVMIMDRGARDSILTFERGVGDAIITYENEILVGRTKGQTYEYVIPDATILIENPVAVIDEYAEAHGTIDTAREFVDFLWTPEMQREYARYGLRPVLDEVAKEVSDRFPAVQALFTIRDLGGWDEAQSLLFSKGGVYEQALTRSRTTGR